MNTSLIGAVAFAAVVGFGVAASAGTQNYSFTGNFSGDADVQFFNFTIGATSDVTLRSYSYAGGTMADGTVIAAGGFDPILALWDGNGNLIEQYDDGPGPVPGDPDNGRHYDTNLTLTGLAAGSYTASIMQYDNFASGSNLSDGFRYTDASFTAGAGCSNGQFCDAFGSNRTSAWAFDVLGVDTAVTPNPSAVPLPAGLPLILTGLLGVGILGRRKKTV